MRKPIDFDKLIAETEAMHASDRDEEARYGFRYYYDYIKASDELKKQYDLVVQIMQIIMKHGFYIEWDLDGKEYALKHLMAMGLIQKECTTLRVGAQGLLFSPTDLAREAW